MLPKREKFNQSAYAAIIGGGPVGIELAACLKRAHVDYLHLEARQIGYTITWWPRNTAFFSTTERIEIAGIPMQTMTQQRATGEEYLAYLRSVVEQLDLQINTYEPVVDIQSQPDGFVLRTSPLGGQKCYFCRKLILAIGDMHAPNLLNIPGEDLPHVSHYFRDPHEYFRKRLLVVGGRNSAVEAALRCWRGGSLVSISYRRTQFDVEESKTTCSRICWRRLKSVILAFSLKQFLLRSHLRTWFFKDRIPVRFEHETDFVLLNTGFHQVPTLFEMAGVDLVGEQRSPVYNPNTMQTNIPGLYVAGTAAAGSQRHYQIFIENSHDHVGKIVCDLTGLWPEKLGTIPSRRYELAQEEFQAN